MEHDYHVYMKSTNQHFYVKGIREVIRLGVPKEDLAREGIKMYRYTVGDFTITQLGG